MCNLFTVWKNGKLLYLLAEKTSFSQRVQACTSTTLWLSTSEQGLDVTTISWWMKAHSRSYRQSASHSSLVGLVLSWSCLERHYKEHNKQFFWRKKAMALVVIAVVPGQALGNSIHCIKRPKCLPVLTPDPLQQSRKDPPGMAVLWRPYGYMSLRHSLPTEVRAGPITLQASPCVALPQLPLRGFL